MPDEDNRPLEWWEETQIAALEAFIQGHHAEIEAACNGWPSELDSTQWRTQPAKWRAFRNRLCWLAQEKK